MTSRGSPKICFVVAGVCDKFSNLTLSILSSFSCLYLYFPLFVTHFVFSRPLSLVSVLICFKAHGVSGNGLSPLRQSSIPRDATWWSWRWGQLCSLQLSGSNSGSLPPDSPWLLGVSLQQKRHEQVRLQTQSVHVIQVSFLTKRWFMKCPPTNWAFHEQIQMYWFSRSTGGW